MTFARLRTTHAVDSQPSVTSTTHVENTELGEQLHAQLLLGGFAAAVHRAVAPAIGVARLLHRAAAGAGAVHGRTQPGRAARKAVSVGGEHLQGDARWLGEPRRCTDGPACRAPTRHRGCCSEHSTPDPRAVALTAQPSAEARARPSCVRGVLNTTKVERLAEGASMASALQSPEASDIACAAEESPRPACAGDSRNRNQHPLGGKHDSVWSVNPSLGFDAGIRRYARFHGDSGCRAGKEEARIRRQRVLRFLEARRGRRQEGAGRVAEIRAPVQVPGPGHRGAAERADGRSGRRRAPRPS